MNKSLVRCDGCGNRFIIPEDDRKMLEKSNTSVICDRCPNPFPVVSKEMIDRYIYDYALYQKRYKDLENRTRQQIINQIIGSNAMNGPMTNVSDGPSMTGTNRQAKNAAIDNSLDRLRNKISQLESRLENTINRIQGNPLPAPDQVVEKSMDKPVDKPVPRPMLHLLAELPNDLDNQGDRVDACQDMITTITEMIL